MNDLFAKNVKNLVTYEQFLTDSDYFFTTPDMKSKSAEKTLRKILQGQEKEAIKKMKASIIEGLKGLSGSDWTYANLEKAILGAYPPSEDPKDAILKIKILRWALSGGKHGPNIYDMLLLLGRERSLHRLSVAELDPEP